jgi:hypothetical protein
MSCYNWERGSITLPKAQWAKFRTELLRAWNNHQEETLKQAKACHAKAKAATKGKRGKSRQEAVLAAIADFCGGSITKWGEFEAPARKVYGYGYGNHEAHDQKKYDLFRALRQHVADAQNNLLKNQPQKKKFPFLALSKSAGLNLCDAHVSFNNENHSVAWEVYENNRAVESANDHWFAKKLFAALGRVKWTRNSGGQIIGNDEYNRDADYEGGGGHYVTKSFGSNPHWR